MSQEQQDSNVESSSATSTNANISTNANTIADANASIDSTASTSSKPSSPAPALNIEELLNSVDWNSWIDEIPEKLTIDYYSVLNLSRNASNRDIKSRFLALSSSFHPDKLPPGIDGSSAFLAISEAYQVLSNEIKRWVYDHYGHEGLEILQTSDYGQEVYLDTSVKRKDVLLKEIDQMLATYQRLNRSNNKKSNPDLITNCRTRGDVLIYTDVSRFIDSRPLGPSFSLIKSNTSRWWKKFIRRFKVHQFRVAPASTFYLGEKDSVSVKGLVVHEDQRLKPSVGVEHVHDWNPRVQTQLGAQLGAEPEANIQVERKLSDSTTMDIGCKWSRSEGGISLSTGATRQLSRESQLGIRSRVAATGHPALELNHSQVLNPTTDINTTISLEPNRHDMIRFGVNRHMSRNLVFYSNFGLGRGPLPFSLECGSRAMLWSRTHVTCGVCLDPYSVSLRFGLIHNNSAFIIPIVLSTHLFSRAYFLSFMFGSLIPFGVIGAAATIADFWAYQAHQQRLHDSCTPAGLRILAARQQAMEEQSVMLPYAYQIMMAEMDKADGLVIEKATFGLEANVDHPDPDFPLTFDCTIPMQYFVKNSELKLTSNKSQLMGMFAPTTSPPSDHRLHIVYRKGSESHQISVTDLEPLHITASSPSS